MNTKQQLRALVLASSLAAFASACGSADIIDNTDPTTEESAGAEAENTCGGGACGAVMATETETTP